MADLTGLYPLISLLPFLTASLLADTLNVCSTRTIPAVTSTVLIQSPRYPRPYNTRYSCTLTIPVPAFSLVTFVVDGDDFSIPAQMNGNCPIDRLDYLLIRTPQRDRLFCGNRTAGTLLRRFYSENPYNVEVELLSSLNQSSSGDYKFSLRYTVFNVLDADVTRSVPSQSQLYFTSHSGYGISQYNHNTDSSLTVTDLLPDTAVRLEFPDGVKLANSDSCSDYLDIVNVRGYPDFTNRICGYTGSVYTADLMSTGDKITFRFKTDTTVMFTGFFFRYTVVSAGCSYAELSNNATLSPTPDSNSTFTLTCLPGFVDSEFTRTQTVECRRRQWKPPPLSCPYVGTTKTTTTTRMTVLYASIGGGVGGVVILVVLITQILMKRRRYRWYRRVLHRSPGKNTNETIEQLSERGQTTAGGQRTGDTNIYTLADSAYELSDSCQLAGEVESPSDVYSLAGPTTETECSAEKTAERVQREKNVADVYADIDVIHKKRPPAVPVDVDMNDMVENDLYTSSF